MHKDKSGITEGYVPPVATRASETERRDGYVPPKTPANQPSSDTPPPKPPEPAKPPQSD